mmetsp:Transcript_12216/g.17720  ORF Transcript_12216/g.17720 Transcript_12216/m.17720 type:complete len:444 (-) Transcript_12216:260-1591(-)
MVSAGSLAPWTVISQGSPMDYHQADILDSFEWSMRHDGDVSSKLASGKIEELTSALLLALKELDSIDSSKRACAMLLKILTFERSMPDEVVACLGEAGFEPLVRHFEKSSSVQVSCSIANAMGMMLCSPKVADLNPVLVETQTKMFLSWLSSVVESKGTPPTELVAALVALGNYLRSSTNRAAFVKDKSSLLPIARLLEKDYYAQVQVEYQTVFVFWLLSFAGSKEQNAAVEEAMNAAEVPRRMTSVLREVTAEKVVRVTLAVLRNLAKDYFGDALRREMIGAGLVGALEQLCLRRWNDQDIRDDLSELVELLQTELQVMSTFDVYRGEVLSGALSWTPAHKDEVFWRENTEKLERNNLEVLRCLARSLHESQDPVVLSVACHDLGMFIKHHERGRHITQTLGVKPRLMELMTAEDAEVRRQALTCVQILMISHHDLMVSGQK